MSELSLFVFGRVQGVFFRKTTQKMAIKFNITGWVRNRKDGSVEILAQGEKANLEKFRAWCEVGSSLSKVERIEEMWREPQKKYLEFSIQETK